MKFLLETHGCQLNQAESNALETILTSLGGTRTDDPYEANLVIVNTCAVRISAENKIWGQLGHYSNVKKTHPFTLIVTGCMADRLKDEIKRREKSVDYVIETNDKLEIESLVLSKELDKKSQYSFTDSYYREGDISSYVPIMNGCNNFCSYCIVPYVRGREISRSAEDILKEIDYLESKNVKEITLLGQNVNSYKGEYCKREINLSELLTLIIPRLNSIRLIYFESPHPKDFSDELIDLISREDRIAKHIHLPFQSGSTRILKLMNRKSTREEIMGLVDKMREKVKGLTFSVDAMTGFPSESEKEFEETLSMMDYIDPTEAFMYFYNPREGTRAYDMPSQISEDVKKERLKRLIDEQLERQKRQKKESLPFQEKAMYLSKSRDNEKEVLLKDEHNNHISIIPLKKHLPGDILKIEVESFRGNTFRGREIE